MIYVAACVCAQVQKHVLQIFAKIISLPVRVKILRRARGAITLNVEEKKVSQAR